MREGQTQKLVAAYDFLEREAGLEGGFEIEGEQVATRPRGVSPEHPRLSLVRRKWLTASRRYPPSPRLADESAGDLVRSDWTRLRPLIDWIAACCPGGQG